MLDEITIQKTGITKSEDIYSLRVDWKAAYEIEPYSGPYTLVLMKEYDPVKTWEEGSNVSSTHTIDVAIDLTATYHVKVGGKLPGGEIQYSESKQLLFHTFGKIEGNYDGKALILKWESREDIVTVSGVPDSGGVVRTDYGDNFIIVPICSELLNEDSTATVRLVPYCEENSSGPAVEVSFFPWPAILESIEKAEDKADGMEITIRLTHPYKEETLSAMNLELVLRTREGDVMTAQNGGVKSGEKAIFSFSGPRAKRELLTYMEAALFIGCKKERGSAGTEIIVKGRNPLTDRGLPLGQIRISSLSSDAKEAVLNWSYDGLSTPSFYELVSGDIVMITAKRDARLTFGTDYTKTVQIRPVFATKKGIPCDSQKLYCPSYFIEKKDGNCRIRLGTESPQQMESAISFAQELFTRHLPKSVSQKGITLTPNSNGLGYVLTVKAESGRTKEDYEVFLTSLCKVDIKPETADPPQSEDEPDIAAILPEYIGVLKDVIARTADCTYEELLYYAYGYSEEDRCVDLRQGMQLHVESEGYKPVIQNGNQGETGAYLPGYYQAAAVSYPVHSYGTGAEWKLGFEPFLSGMKVERAGRALNALERQNAGGGIMDLFKTSFRKSNYCLHYPARFLDSQSAGSDYAPSNVCIVGASTYQQLRSAVKEMNSQKEVKDPAVELAYFRGRVVLIPKIAVSVNGQYRQVSVGMTVRHILEQEGALGETNPVGFSMERRCALDGSGYLPVQVISENDIADWINLPLLNGDRLKFR